MKAATGRTYVLIPGAAADSWYWHLVEAELRSRGRDVLSVDLPVDDDSAGLAEYAETVVDAIGDRTGVVLVAHSFGGFTAPLVCERTPVDLMVLVTAMIPSPGEAPGAWGEATGHTRARAEQQSLDGVTSDNTVGLFLNGVPPGLAAEALTKTRSQSGTPFEEPWPLAAWPPVPTRFLLCRDDRFFPPGFMRRVVRERLGIVPDEMDGGHSVTLSHAKELADRLEDYSRNLS